VEDYLVQLSVLDEESGVQREALESAREALRLAENQYKAGTVDYTDVVTNQATALSNERTVLTLLGSRRPLPRSTGRWRSGGCRAGS
ncbi:TolC family protein, partial [Pseudomonas aeruginosa]